MDNVMRTDKKSLPPLRLKTPHHKRTFKKDPAGLMYAQKTANHTRKRKKY